MDRTEQRAAAAASVVDRWVAVGVADPHSRAGSPGRRRCRWSCARCWRWRWWRGPPRARCRWWRAGRSWSAGRSSPSQSGGNRDTHIMACLSTDLPICLSVRLPACLLSVRLSRCLSTSYLSVCLSIPLVIYLFYSLDISTYYMAILYMLHSTFGLAPARSGDHVSGDHVFFLCCCFRQCEIWVCISLKKRYDKTRINLPCSVCTEKVVHIFHYLSLFLLFISN